MSHACVVSALYLHAVSHPRCRGRTFDYFHCMPVRPLVAAPAASTARICQRATPTCAQRSLIARALILDPSSFRSNDDHQPDPEH